MTKEDQPNKTSRVPGFYQLSPEERVRVVSEFGELNSTDRELLLAGETLPLEKAQNMVENVTTVFGLPHGIAANFRIDDSDLFIPMVVEEPSVVAAASHAAKLLRGGRGIETRADNPVMIGQIQLCDIPDLGGGREALLAKKAELIDAANATQPRLVSRGGGAVDLQVRAFPSTREGAMLVVHLLVDVRDAMGANMVNTMVESIADQCAKLSGGNPHLRILSNLAAHRLVHATGRVPLTLLDRASKTLSGAEVAQRVERASVFAEVDPYRATTHNKGFMNGVDAFLIAMGQDWRAVEAGAHAYAAQGGHYTALATWRVVGDELIGSTSLPMQVGTVGGIIPVHPQVGLNHRLLRLDGAGHLGRVAAAVGLAQNLAAILALSTDGIQRGHMALHARNIASAVGAEVRELDTVVEQMIAENAIHQEAATRILAQMRQSG